MSPMTDGERLVWAAAFARSIEHNNDGTTAVKAATRIVQKLREVADSPETKAHFSIDERDMLDEIAMVP
jgi:hypothetical protein